MDSVLLRQHLELEETHWWFASRRTILLGILKKHLQNSSGKPDILDVGCGGGLMMDRLRKYGRVSGIEVAPEAVEYNRSAGRDVISGVIEELPYADNSFDLVLALDVIEHTPDDGLGLAELHRVLRPDGYALVTVPALKLLWGKHDVANGHYRRYTVTELKCAMQQAKLKPLKATYFNTLLFPMILAARLSQRFGTVDNTSDVVVTPEPWNTLLKKVFTLELSLIEHFDFPIGVSAMCLAHKTEMRKES